MSTKEQTRKSKLINLRITDNLYVQLKKLKINISDTCREALRLEVCKLLKGSKNDR